VTSVGALLLILAVSSLYFFVADDGNEVSVGDDEDVLSVTDDGNELGITVDEESDSGLTNAEEIDASDREAATELIETVETVAEPTPVPRNIDELVERGALMLDPETTEPYSGQAFELFLAADSTNPFGPHTTTYTYTDGERHGPAWSHYNDNGQLLDTANYKDGELDGPIEIYYENGQLQTMRNYGAGEYQGPLEIYYENGQLRLKNNYKDGELDGPFEIYYENGQLERRGTYLMGEGDGLAEHYYENGQLSGRSSYKDGELDGPGEWYYENGQLEVKGTFNMGQKCGEWIEDGETVTFDPCPPGLEDGN